MNLLRNSNIRIGWIACLLLPLAGCSDSGAVPEALQGVAVHGTVKSGITAVNGAHVYLLAAGTGGYGTASTSLLTSGQSGVAVDGNGNGYVTSASDGTFNIGGDYSCPSSNTLVYLLATGGNPGLANGTNNTALSLMTGLSACGSLNASNAVVVNEETTVATAYALSAFATSSTKIASGSTTTGIANAFAIINTLVNINTGVSNPFTASNVGNVPQFEFNSLSNLLNACTSTVGPTSTGCASLFAAATPSGGTAPADTVQAMLNIAHNPGSNVSTLYKLSLTSTVFGSIPGSGILAALPNDWTLSITFSSSSAAGLKTPAAIAIDTSGNAWITNETGNSVTEFSSTGALLSPSGGYTGPFKFPEGITIDPSGNIWVANAAAVNSPDLTELSSSGAVTNSITLANVSSPNAIASDASGNIWLTNQFGTGNLFEISGAGTAISPAAGYTATCLADPNGIAIDPKSEAWVIGANSTCLAEFSSTTVLSGATGYKGGGLQYSQGGIAIDASGNVWVASNNGALSIGAAGAVSEFNSSGSSVSSSLGYSAGGIFNPTGLAIDGAGNVWVSNSTQFNPPPTANITSRISVISNTGTGISPAAGYLQGQVGAIPGSVAIDGSGNVWVPDSTNNSVFMMIGAAAPVTTPLSVAIKNNKLGTRP